MACEDQYLFNAGTHCQAYDMLGAHPRCVDVVAGVYFALWAPSARRVSVVGDFNFVDYCHRHSIGVILDWVPGHFPVDAHGVARFDGTGLYEHIDPRQDWHPDWQTLVLNYGCNEVRSFLLSNAFFWLERYHIDGLRVDALALMLYLNCSREEGASMPNANGGRENLEAIDFLQQLNATVDVARGRW